MPIRTRLGLADPLTENKSLPCAVVHLILEWLKGKQMLTQHRLKELLDYDPLTGIFSWRVNRQGRFARIGNRAGSIGYQGYVSICVDRRKYRAHQLAYLYVYGHFPSGGLDHKHRVGIDNRIENLRSATQSENGQNTSLFKNNTSGVKGVSWSNANNKWEAYIMLHRKRKYLGRYDSLFDAVCARKTAEIAMHPYRVV